MDYLNFFSFFFKKLKLNPKKLLFSRELFLLENYFIYFICKNIF